MYHRKILEDCGFEVDEAVNGLEALEKAFTTPYDLFIVDINMPKMDGYRFIAELRAREELSQVPAIMVSTESETKDSDRAFAAGANFYLIKPARPVELTTSVRLMLGEPA
jgi:two-component system chemotaxis response regulator CheY